MYEIFNLDKASATSGCSMAVNIKHNIERNSEFVSDITLCSTQPISFIERFCSKLNYNNELFYNHLVIRVVCIA